MSNNNKWSEFNESEWKKEQQTIYDKYSSGEWFLSDFLAKKLIINIPKNEHLDDLNIKMLEFALNTLNIPKDNMNLKERISYYHLLYSQE